MNTITQTIGKSSDSLKILFGPTFSIWRPSRLVDEGLITELIGEGNSVVGQYCGKAQTAECNVYGGDWLKGSSFESKCASCQKQSSKFWQKLDLSGPEPRILKNEGNVDSMLADFQQAELEGFTFEGICFGELAADIVRNNSLVDDKSLAPDYIDRLRIQIINLLTMYKQYEKSIIATEPDRIISNDSFYGMWRVLQYAAAKYSVPFYSTWPITSDRVVFAQNGPSMDRNLSLAFKAVGSKIELEEKSQDFLSNWQNGKRNLFIPVKTRNEQRSLSELINRINGRKSFVLVSNVVWDLASLNKDVAFASIREWVQQTVDWFRNHPEVFLIIKPHPAEIYKNNPATRETIGSYLSESLPSNVVLLPYQTFSIQNIVSEIKPVSFLVHTSTVGYEVAMMGRKSICVGRSIYKDLGFTVDVESPIQYFKELSIAVNGDGTIDSEKTDLARKFSSLYNHRFQVFVGELSVGRRKFLEKFHKLAIDSDSGLNYVLNRIKLGEPIIDEISIPPVSGGD